MEHIKTAITKVTNDMKVQKKTLEQLIKHSKTLNALDLLSEPLSENEMNVSLTLVKKELEDGLGFRINDNFIILLKKMFLKDNWTKEKLFYSVKKILKTYKYTEKHLKPADFYENSEIKMYSYSEYLKNLKDFGTSFNQEIEWYRIKDKPFYVLKSDIEYNLPFERI